MSRRQDITAEAARRSPDSPPRLAFYIHSMEGGGAERVSALVASGFARRGYSVDLVLNRAEGPHMTFVAHEVRVVPLECNTIDAAPRLVRYLRDTRPSALVSALQHNNLNAAIAARLTGTPFAATVHGVMSVHHRNSRASGVISRTAQAASPLIYRLADAVGVVSDAVSHDIPYAARRPGKFHVLYNPVDTEHFSPLPRAHDAAATRLPHDDGSPIVLGVGRFDRAKNFDLLIKSVAAMQTEQPTRLVLLGEGPERGRLEQLAVELGIAARVFMPGFVADPASWYRRVAVHAVASECEGFGNTIVESLATGTPVVIARCLGAPEELLGNGRFGAIVPADPADMAAAFVHAIRNRPEPGPLVARAQEFSLERCVDRYEIMLKSMRGTRRDVAAKAQGSEGSGAPA